MAPLAVRSIKKTLQTDVAEKVRSALERELTEQQRLWATQDSRIGIEANLKRATPEFVGA